MLHTLRQEIRAGVREVGEIWSSDLTDNVTLNINIEYDSLDEFTAGEADSNTVEVSYQDFYRVLNNNTTSQDDFAA